MVETVTETPTPTSIPTPDEIKNLKCSTHNDCLKDHYCETCRELMCMNCRLSHDDGHVADAVANISVKTLKKLEAIIRDMSAGKDLLKEEAKFKTDIGQKMKGVDETKEQLKAMTGKLIDKLFDIKIINKREEYLAQLNKASNELASANTKLAEIEQKKELLNQLIYQKYNYERICGLYLEDSPIDLVMSKHVEEFKRIKANFESLEIAKSTETIKNIFTKHFNSAIECHVCKTTLVNDIIEGTCDLSSNICAACKTKIDAINWTNGTKTSQGNTATWNTFCTTEPLPPYFRCEIKVHEACDASTGNRFIGVSKNKCESTDGNFNNSNDWWAINNDKGICKKGEEAKERGKVTFDTADAIVSLIYDNTKTLQFEVNGVSTEQTYKEIEGPFYLACADLTGSQYTIVSIKAL